MWRRAAPGAALGLVLGGALTSALGWRWVMFVNVPIGAVAFLGVRTLIAETRRHRARLDLGGARFVTGTTQVIDAGGAL
jgi:MFS family permease